MGDYGGISTALTLPANGAQHVRNDGWVAGSRNASFHSLSQPGPEMSKARQAIDDACAADWPRVPCPQSRLARKITKTQECACSLYGRLMHYGRFDKATLGQTSVSLPLSRFDSEACGRGGDSWTLSCASAPSKPPTSAPLLPFRHPPQDIAQSDRDGCVTLHRTYYYTTSLEAPSTALCVCFAPKQP